MENSSTPLKIIPSTPVTLPAGSHSIHIQSSIRKKDMDFTLSSDAVLYLKWNRTWGTIETAITPPQAVGGTHAAYRKAEKYVKPL